MQKNMGKEKKTKHSVFDCEECIYIPAFSYKKCNRKFVVHTKLHKKEKKTADQSCEAPHNTVDKLCSIKFTTFIGKIKNKSQTQLSNDE